MKEVVRSNHSTVKSDNRRPFRKAVRARFGSRIYVSTILTLAAIASIAVAGFYSSPAGAQGVRTRVQQDIEQVFTRHEELTVDPQAAADRVRDSGRLSLVTP